MEAWVSWILSLHGVPLWDYYTASFSNKLTLRVANITCLREYDNTVRSKRALSYSVKSGKLAFTRYYHYMELSLGVTRLLQLSICKFSLLIFRILDMHIFEKTLQTVH